MIKVQHVEPDDFTISDGADTIRLSRVDYEDVFFAIPLDSPALYLLLNQTILQTVKVRDALKRIIDRHGGIDAAMQALQTAVQTLDPKAPAATATAAAVAAPSRPSPAPVPPVAPVVAPAKEYIPTAQVVAPPPKPAKVTAAPTPAQSDMKKTSIIHEKVSVAHVVPEKAKTVKVVKGADSSYTINFGSQNVVLSNAKFKELYFALPMDIPSVFKLFFTSLLPDVKSKSAFRRMMSMAGGSSVFLGLVVKELEKMRAQDV